LLLFFFQPNAEEVLYVEGDSLLSGPYVKIEHADAVEAVGEFVGLYVSQVIIKTLILIFDI